MDMFGLGSFSLASIIYHEHPGDLEADRKDLM